MRRLMLAALAALVSTPAAAADANLLDGTFEGGYTCAQGLTFLRLMLDGDADGYVRGSFFFSSVKWQGGSNLTVPDGEFTVTGRLNDQGQIVLQGDRWDATYIPLSVQRQPFLIGIAGEERLIHNRRPSESWGRYRRSTVASDPSFRWDDELKGISWSFH